jgi:glycosyltransferase involved in cell wall biosynthesis
MSEHEGFGGPLLEAMSLELPVVARAAAAVPETLDGAGILVAEPDPAVVAEIAERLFIDAPLREGVVSGQNRRVAAAQGRDIEAEIRELLAPVLE